MTSASNIPTVVLTRDPSDPVAGSGPAAWAAGQLAHALTARGVRVLQYARVDDAPASGVSLEIRLSGSAAPDVRGAFDAARVAIPEAPEALGLLHSGDRIIAAGQDVRGLVYASLELSDRVQMATGSDALESLKLERPIVQAPANAIRAIARLFVSDVEDLAWFHDRDFWREYLSHLVAQRFNRVHLAFGIGHDFLRNVLDAYLLFAYPFLVDVPGYDVRVAGLSAAERQRNLDTLRFASDEAAARGLHFQLGLWTQAYEWVDSPDANYVIEGLDSSNHAAYCRDAVQLLLQACPSVAGVTFRVHGESGVPEGNYEFWREVFRGVVGCGRRLELDLHPKGVGPEMIRVALETGLPVTLSPKYTAEHIGLPAHQVEIRSLERTGDPFREADGFVEHLMNQSGGALRYTRYGNADFFREDRQYGLFYRIWPGTQRLLLWGDPRLAAGFGRWSSFCGSLGAELCEPLSFKGRRGSGHKTPGGREGYADQSLRQEGGADWQKFRYTYRVFGRLLYDPDEDAAVWQRALAKEFGAAAAPALEATLAGASRILPLVTSAYHPSAANNRYWPEMYTTLPIVNADRPHPYRDTPSPRRFGAASPLDPGLFAGVDEFVHEITTGAPSGRVSPVRVASILDSLADEACRQLASAEQTVLDPGAPPFRRVSIDVQIQAALGHFFAAKLRAGVAYGLWRATGERPRLRQALDEYAVARSSWLQAVEPAKVYRTDLTVGGEPWLRGHWSDRLAGIDADLQDMRAEWDRSTESSSAPDKDTDTVPSPLNLLDPAPPRDGDVYHVPAPHFRPGEPLDVRVKVRSSGGQPRVSLHYRHVNQAELYSTVEMDADEDGGFRATVPGQYTDSPYPLQYYFVLRRDGRAWRIPDLADDLANQPYWVVRQAERTDRRLS